MGRAGGSRRSRASVEYAATTKNLQPIEPLPSLKNIFTASQYACAATRRRGPNSDRTASRRRRRRRASGAAAAGAGAGAGAAAGAGARGRGGGRWRRRRRRLPHAGRRVVVVAAAAAAASAAARRRRSARRRCPAPSAPPAASFRASASDQVALAQAEYVGGGVEAAVALIRSGERALAAALEHRLGGHPPDLAHRRQVGDTVRRLLARELLRRLERRRLRSRTVCHALPPSDILYIRVSTTCLPQIAQSPLAYAHVEQYCAWFCDVFCLQILHTCEYGFCRTPLRSSLFSSTRRTAEEEVEAARHGSGAETVESFDLQSSQTMALDGRARCAVVERCGRRGRRARVRRDFA